MNGSPQWHWPPSRGVRLAARQKPKICGAHCACRPRGGEAVTGKKLLADRNNLLADQDAGRPTRHKRRRRRANVQEAVDDADQNAGAG